MAVLKIPYDRGELPLAIDDSRLAAVLTPKPVKIEAAPAEIVAGALANPIASPTLAELARGKRRVVVVTSDHTRPLPSRETMPVLLAEIRRGNPEAEIVILVATGTHRPSTSEEMAAKFGPELFAAERFVCHRSSERTELVTIGNLPSGVPLEINRLAAEADLLVAEGFIEPHFFAGFSGGPKSILPGIAGQTAIRANHSGPNIAHPKARTGRIEGNPIQEEIRAAASLAKLSFILNVVLAKGGRIAAAYAGDWRAAHAEGVKFALAHAGVPIVPAPVTVTSNGGYPLDQNLYQAVKGMTAAEAMTTPGGRIIIAAGCADGLGGEGFARLMAGMSSPESFLAKADATPPAETPPDLWEAQILARVLAKCRVTLVSRPLPPGTVLPPGLSVTEDLQEAVDTALEEAGPEAKVTVIPDGVAVVPVKE